MLFARLQGPVQREGDRIRASLLEIHGFVPLLIKQRNGLHMTADERGQWADHLRTLPQSISRGFPRARLVRAVSGCRLVGSDGSADITMDPIGVKPIRFHSHRREPLFDDQSLSEQCPFPVKLLRPMGGPPRSTSRASPIRSMRGS